MGTGVLQQFLAKVVQILTIIYKKSLETVICRMTSVQPILLRYSGKMAGVSHGIAAQCQRHLCAEKSLSHWSEMTWPLDEQKPSQRQLAWLYFNHAQLICWNFLTVVKAVDEKDVEDDIFPLLWPLTRSLERNY
jgi:hypothetical protein